MVRMLLSDGRTGRFMMFGEISEGKQILSSQDRAEICLSVIQTI